MIEMRDVDYTYPAVRAPALRRLSFTLSPAEWVVLLGSNGSGKSTLARLCDGLLTPQRGTVFVDGIDTRDQERVWDIRAKVGLVLQDPDDQIVGTVVEEDVAFGPENLGVERYEIRARVDDALALVGLTGFERREPHLLSEGQKQRVAIAGTLALRPQYLVLDEPVAMLDARGRGEVVDVLDRLVRTEGSGVLQVSHDVADTVRADRVLVLVEGEAVYDGDPAGLWADRELMSRAGVALPPVGELAASLRRLGVAVPASAMTAESVVASLWH